MAKGGCDVAFVVDPDVDRLAMILSLIHIYIGDIRTDMKTYFQVAVKNQPHSYVSFLPAAK